MMCKSLKGRFPDSVLFIWSRSQSSFTYSQLSVRKTKHLKEKPKENLGFGKHFTDHMLLIDWDSKSGWGKPIITPFSQMSFSPAIKAIHYATSCFEGLKTVKGADGVCRLFRADQHMKRFKTSAERLCLPSFDPSELLNCIKELIKLDKAWVPSGASEALYIRPFLFGCDPTLGVDVSTEAKLCTILSPVGSYFAAGKKDVSLYADTQFVRAFEGGCGAYKLSANYAPTLYVQQIVKQKGCQTSLWLYGKEEYITEAGTMNIFVYWTNENGEKELATPPLNGLILPGVTRDSILEIAKQLKEFKVSERTITMAQVLQALKDHRLHSIFGTGTACVISPVAELVYKDVRYPVPVSEDSNSITERLYKTYREIQLGLKGPHPWLIPID